VLSQKTTPKRVLLVEDDDLLRKSLSGYIGALGYEVIAADSAEEALLLCGPGSVDLVLTDYRLLTMNGIDLILTLRKSGLDVPCILISGFLSDEDRRRALEIRVTDILRKPWDLPRLQDLLPNLLGEVACTAPGTLKLPPGRFWRSARSAILPRKTDPSIIPTAVTLSSSPTSRTTTRSLSPWHLPPGQSWSRRASQLNNTDHHFLISRFLFSHPVPLHSENSSLFDNRFPFAGLCRVGTAFAPLHSCSSSVHSQ